jgi:predicted esterase
VSALATAGLVYRVERHPVPQEPLTAAVTPAPEPDEGPADWCAPGFEPIRGACFARASSSPAPLVVYLHGRYARASASDEIDRQRRLAARATALGFAVVALRGRLGTCTSPDLASWYCWPSNGNNADRGAEFVDSWKDALATAQERAGSRQRFLLGFSNGGYFAGLIASRGLLDVEALVVAHGGPVEPVQALHGTPPLLLLSADDDVAQDDMIRFDEELSRARWAHDSYARAGGHGLTDGDIDAALTFFARAREPLPLEPPLALHRPVRHARDAGPDAEVPAEAPAEARDEGGVPPSSPGTSEEDASESPSSDP